MKFEKLKLALLRKRSSAPDLARRLHHNFELAPLIVIAYQVADYIRGKAALRTDGDLLDGRILSGSIDAPFEFIDGFELRHLCAHQTQDNHLSLRQEPQGFESAGARCVVLEE